MSRCPNDQPLLIGAMVLILGAPAAASAVVQADATGGACHDGAHASRVVAL